MGIVTTVSALKKLGTKKQRQPRLDQFEKKWGTTCIRYNASFEDITERKELVDIEDSGPFGVLFSRLTGSLVHRRNKIAYCPNVEEFMRFMGAYGANMFFKVPIPNHVVKFRQRFKTDRDLVQHFFPVHLDVTINTDINPLAVLAQVKDILSIARTQRILFGLSKPYCVTKRLKQLDKILTYDPREGNADNYSQDMENFLMWDLKHVKRKRDAEIVRQLWPEQYDDFKKNRRAKEGYKSHLLQKVRDREKKVKKWIAFFSDFVRDHTIELTQKIIPIHIFYLVGFLASCIVRSIGNYADHYGRLKKWKPFVRRGATLRTIRFYPQRPFTAYLGILFRN